MRSLGVDPLGRIGKLLGPFEGFAVLMKEAMVMRKSIIIMMQVLWSNSYVNSVSIRCKDVDPDIDISSKGALRVSEARVH